MVGFAFGEAIAGTPDQHAREKELKRRGKESWHLPSQQNRCAQLVLGVARENNRRVTIFDVNRPAGRLRLVDRWFRENGLLPVLVRPDGSWLAGLESFVPKRMRRFVA